MDKKTVKKKKQSFNKLKRKNVEYGMSMIALVIMVPIFFATALLLVVIPRSQESQLEKRKLAEMPTFSFESYFSGEFTTKLAEYYDDTVPFRDELKELGYNIRSYFGIHTEDEVKIIGKPVQVVNKDKDKEKNKNNETSQQSAPSKQESSSPSDTSAVVQESSAGEDSISEVSEEEPEYTVENGIIVVKQNGHYRALELFGGGTGNTYVNALNNFRKDLDKNVRMFSLIAPLASEYYTPSNYSGLTVDQKEVIDSIYSRLDSGITGIDVDSVLAQHADEEIYFRTDHHWTALGAYYSAQEFAKRAGLSFKELSTYKENVIDEFMGTMSGFTGDANLTNDPERFVYYSSDNIGKCTTYYYDTSFNYSGSGNFFNGVYDPKHNAYLTYMGGDEKIIKVTTNVKNGKSLMIVKDSYGNAIPGFLFGSYENIFVVDMRFFNLNLVDFVEANNINDVLFSMVIYSAVGTNADNLETLRTQAKGQTIIDGALADESSQ